MTEQTNKENTVFIGKKPTQSYVLAVLAQLNQGAKIVTIKARGRTISKAVDVAEIIRNKYMQDLKIADIIISTESLKASEGDAMVNVSSIEIKMNK